MVSCPSRTCFKNFSPIALKTLGKKACVIVTSIIDIDKGFYKDNTVIKSCHLSSYDVEAFSVFDRVVVDQLSYNLDKDFPWKYITDVIIS